VHLAFAQVFIYTDVSTGDFVPAGGKFLLFIIACMPAEGKGHMKKGSPVCPFNIGIQSKHPTLKVAGSNPVGRTTKNPRNLAKFRRFFVFEDRRGECMRYMVCVHKRK
jgi:hypothetical protein